LNIMESRRISPRLRVCANQPQAREKGFTLIEIMVAITIMAILFAIAVPAFQNWRERTALRSASETMLAHLKQARHYAMAENRSIDFTIDATDPDSYTLDDGGAHARQVSLDQYSKTIDFGSSTISDGIKLRSDGQIANIDGSSLMGTSIFLESSTVSHQWKITVNRIGRAYLQHSATGTF